jgi:hypothetical protein
MADGIFRESSSSSSSLKTNNVFRTQEAWARRLEHCMYGFVTTVIVALAIIVFIAIPNEVRVEREQEQQQHHHEQLIPSVSPTTIIYDAQGAGTYFRDFTDFPTRSPTSRRLPTNPTKYPTIPPTSLRVLEPTAPTKP